MKKTIPLGIRNILEEFAEEKANLFSVIFDSNSIVSFKDLDRNSDFNFTLEKIDVHQDNKTSYLIEYKPSNEENLNPNRVRVNLSDIKSHFNKWKNLLRAINKKSNLFDDPIANSYYDEIEEYFTIIDDDAEFKSYSIKEQIKINEFLDSINEMISNENQKDSDVLETLSFIEITKKSLSKSTKSEVVKNIRKIISKAFKISLQIGEKLLINFTTELAKKLLEGK